MSSNVSAGPKFLFIRDKGRHYRIDFARIRYLEARKCYCRIVTTERSWTIKVGIGQLQGYLPAGDFCRIHRSFVVGIAHIEWFEYNLVRVGEEDLPLGDKNREMLLRKVLVVAEEPLPGQVMAPVKEMVLA